MSGEETNAAQIEYWNSEQVGHWIENADRYDEMLAGFGTHVLDRAEIASGARVLDVGCGNGAMTLDAARRAAGGVAHGLDISEPMITLARERARAAGAHNARFEIGDAQTATSESPFDVVVSRFGVMFFDDPVAAFANIRKALRPGGLLVFACWRDLLLNEWMTVPLGAALQHVPPPQLGDPTAPGPYSLADEDHLTGVLDDAGWPTAAIEPLDMRMLIGGRGTVDEAVDFMRHTGMGQMLLGDADPDAAARALDAVRAALAEHHNGDGVELVGAAWLVAARV